MCACGRGLTIVGTTHCPSATHGPNQKDRAASAWAMGTGNRGGGGGSPEEVMGCDAQEL